MSIREEDDDDDASSVSSLWDSHTDEDDEEDTNRDDDEVSVFEPIIENGRHKVFICDINEDSFEDRVEVLRQLRDAYVPIEWGEDWYNFHIYVYYRKRRGYGGYGIVIRHVNSRKYIGAYYFASKGGSYLYYLLEGIKRCLEIINEWGFDRFRWSINSRRASDYFNNIFSDPICLTECFHYKRDIADINYCKSCLGDQMLLTPGKFEPLDAVIKAILKMQYESKFKFRGGCDVQYIVAAQYIARLGAEALVRKMEPGVSPDQVLEVKVKMEEEEIEALEQETGLGVECRKGLKW